MNFLPRTFIALAIATALHLGTQAFAAPSP